ncbi:HAD-like protein [Aureobasidium subglaciale]|nr:HAD-like protein [Aureobasidium subglaciale]
MTLALCLDVCAAEGAIPKKWGHDAVEIPGSRSILESLEQVSAPWAIVTSGTQPLVTGWLEVMGLAHPKHLVSAEQVAKGKPDPACYKLGAERLGIKGDDVLVLEDAPAGYKVVALTTTHTVQQLQEAGATWIVRDMRSVTMKNFDKKTGKVEVSIKDALVQ